MNSISCPAFGSPIVSERPQLISDPFPTSAQNVGFVAEHAITFGDCDLVFQSDYLTHTPNDSCAEPDQLPLNESLV